MTLDLPMVLSNSDSKEKVWQHQAMCRLPKVECHDLIGSAYLKLKGSKCVLFSTKVSFLGITLLKEGILLAGSKNVARILNWPVPKTVHDVRGILALRSYYHHLFQNFSDRTWPPVALTKKNKPFHWTEEYQKVFDDIK